MRFMKSIGSSSTKNDYYKEGELRIYNKNNSNLKKGNSKHRKVSSDSALRVEFNT